MIRSRQALQRREHQFETVPSGSEDQQRTLNAPSSVRQIASPYLSSRECLIYLRLRTLSALYYHIKENGLPVCRIGGDMRFDTRDLDQWLRTGGNATVELRRARKQA